MLSVTLAALMMFAQEPAAASPPQAAASAEVQETTRLEDIDVVGRTLDTMIRDFVGEVAAQSRSGHRPLGGRRLHRRGQSPA